MALEAAITKVKTLQGNREAIDAANLEQQLQELNNEPSILVSRIGLYTRNQVSISLSPDSLGLSKSNRSWMPLVFPSSIF